MRVLFDAISAGTKHSVQDNSEIKFVTFGFFFCFTPIRIIRIG